MSSMNMKSMMVSNQKTNDVVSLSSSDRNMRFQGSMRELYTTRNSVNVYLGRGEGGGG